MATLKVTGVVVLTKARTSPWGDLSEPLPLRWEPLTKARIKLRAAEMNAGEAEPAEGGC